MNENLNSLKTKIKEYTQILIENDPSALYSLEFLANAWSVHANKELERRSYTLLNFLRTFSTEELKAVINNKLEIEQLTTEIEKAFDKKSKQKYIAEVPS